MKPFEASGRAVCWHEFPNPSGKRRFLVMTGKMPALRNETSGTEITRFNAAAPTAVAIGATQCCPGRMWANICALLAALVAEHAPQGSDRGAPGRGNLLASCGASAGYVLPRPRPIGGGGLEDNAGALTAKTVKARVGYTLDAPDPARACRGRPSVPRPWTLWKTSAKCKRMRL